ncbi:MAG: hypothetical protein ACREE9_05325 [Stellaceae bacterium]
MLSRQHQPYPRGDDRERITRARQAAEALFKAKPISGLSVADTAPPDQLARKPRVLRITSPAVPEPETPVAPELPRTSPVPALQVARIRAWVKYGMTLSQVAEVYGAGVDEIKRILRQGL